MKYSIFIFKYPSIVFLLIIFWWLLVFSSMPVMAAQDSISVKGDEFIKEGKPWIARGVTLEGLTFPETNKRHVSPLFRKARLLFGEKLLGDIKAYGADTVRFMISQGGLDPSSSHYDPDYKVEILRAVELARKNGFNVILAMQWLNHAGYDDKNMPYDSTQRAWKQLVDKVGGDQGILVEIFNEPGLRQTTSGNWSIWQKKMQALITALRNDGFKNVMLIDGLNYAHTFDGMPDLHDSLNSLGYAVHPYLAKENRSQAQWDKNFGDLASRLPVMATEFMANSADCRPSLPKETQELLGYLRDKKIGLVNWGWDIGRIKKGKELSSFKNFTCTNQNWQGAGELIHEHFTR